MKRLARILAFVGAPTISLAPALAQAAEPKPLPALTIAADGGLGMRKLGWKDDIFGTLRDYNLSAAPSVGGEIAVYPAAFFTRSAPAWLGLFGRVEGMPGLQSQRSRHDDVLPTRAFAYNAAVRLRAPVRFGAFRLEAGVAGRSFTVGRAGITDPDVPSVQYLGPSFGLGAEVSLPAGLSLAPRASVAFWTRMGDVASADWFPRAQAWGARFGLRFAWAAPYGLSPYLDLDWSRENPRPPSRAGRRAGRRRRRGRYVFSSPRPGVDLFVSRAFAPLIAAARSATIHCLPALCAASWR
ncbi:MAG: hypothetical protein QM820_56415 [Minicystis sp.]